MCPPCGVERMNKLQIHGDARGSDGQRIGRGDAIEHRKGIMLRGGIGQIEQDAMVIDQTHGIAVERKGHRRAFHHM